jgi:hypothetical protein
MFPYKLKTFCLFENVPSSRSSSHRGSRTRGARDDGFISGLSVFSTHTACVASRVEASVSAGNSLGGWSWLFEKKRGGDEENWRVEEKPFSAKPARKRSRPAASAPQVSKKTISASYNQFTSTRRHYCTAFTHPLQPSQFIVIIAYE